MVYLFQAGIPFPQRTRNGLFLGKFIQRIKTQICTFFVMKILDAPSQFKNVRNTTSQCHRHQLRQKIHHVRQKYIMYAKQNTTYTKHQVHQTKTKFSNQNTKYAKQNTKYAKQNTKYWFTLFCRKKFLSQIYALFGVPFTGLKVWWRTKNDNYQVCVLQSERVTGTINAL